MILMSVVVPWAAHTTTFDHSHAAFDAVLKAHVRDGWVDYARLKANPRPLRAYLDQLAAVSEAEFNRWPGKERFAFLSNLYNASTLALIVDHYPVKSIKDIGGFLKGPWDQPAVRLFGNVTTLNHVEHEIIRKRYYDPRAHFALVCAARGCPPLRAEAYVAARLDEQLDNQGRIFLSQTNKNRVDAGSRVLYLSPIFKWFSGDFEQKSGSILRFVEPYLSEQDRRTVSNGDFKIRYTDYDWSLNDQTRK